MPLYLSIWGDLTKPDFSDAVRVPGGGFKFNIKPEYLQVLKKCYLQLFFPDGSAFESEATEGDLSTEGSLSFETFYPLDIPQIQPVPTKIKDFLLGVPSGLDKLSQIRGRFILVD